MNTIDFVCVGPQRTGTTWLDKMLREHHNLSLPQGVKETRFFDQYYERGYDWYASYFSNVCAGDLVGEVAPTYFDSPEVHLRISDSSPDCLIFVTLRDPAERAWSLFLHHLRKARVPRNFWKASKLKPSIVRAGKYARHVRRWKEVFGHQQVIYLFMEDIRDRPSEVLEYIQNTLGVECMKPPETRDKSVNSTSMPRFPWLARGAAFLASKLHKYGFHGLVNIAREAGLKSLVYTGGEGRIPSMPSSLRTSLLEEYEEDILFLEEETGRDLSDWRRT